MIISIYHRDPLSTGIRDVDLSAPHKFIKAGSVLCSDAGQLMGNLETAFQATNSLNQSWSHFPAANVLPTELSRRSTAVGDIAVVNNEHCFLCLNSGWQKLSVPPSQIIGAPVR